MQHFFSNPRIFSSAETEQLFEEIITQELDILVLKLQIKNQHIVFHEIWKYIQDDVSSMEKRDQIRIITNILKIINTLPIPEQEKTLVWQWLSKNTYIITKTSFNLAQLIKEIFSSEPYYSKYLAWKIPDQIKNILKIGE